MMDVQAIAEWLESEGYACGPYSGRGMYGAKCLSITSKDGDDLSTGDLVRLGFIAGWADAETDGTHPARFLEGGSAVDSLGRGIVVYWPALRWPEAEAE